MPNMSLHLQIGLLLLLLPGWPERAPAAPRETTVVDLNLTNGLGRLIISEQNNALTVQVPVEARRQSVEGATAIKPPPNAAKLGLQVWLLKADGTVIRQRSADQSPSMDGGVGIESWFVTFYFDKVPLGDIAGITLRREGRLYSQPTATAQN